MSLRDPPVIVRVDDVVAVPWRNGGGVTRQLLAWPDPRDWLLRVSVADIHASGPFSQFPGVDRWFAVLAGGAVRLATADTAPLELTVTHTALHAFPGEATTYCTALGAATRDFNLMARRGRVALQQRPLCESAVLETAAAGAGLFVAQATDAGEDSGPVATLPAMALAWWENPRRERRVLRATDGEVRGWWFEVATGSR